MAIVSMADAVSGGTASSAEYNKLIDNIEDLDARLGPVVSSSTAHARLNTLESRTTDTATSPGGIGNQRLADRFGSGVGTGSNVVTGSASSQLADIRSRISVVESRTTDTVTSPGGIGNQQLADRLGSGVGTGSNVTTGSATSQFTDIRSRVTTLETGGVPAGSVFVKGHFRTTTQSIAGTSETAYATSPSFTPVANTVYMVVATARVDVGTEVAAPIYFLHIRETSVAGTERADTRMDLKPTAGAFEFTATYIFDSGASPTAKVFLATISRSTGSTGVTTKPGSSVVIYRLGSTTDFTSS